MVPCEQLVHALFDAERLLAHSVGELSPLFAEAHGLLEHHDHSLGDPLHSLSAAAQGLGDDGRDLDWRLEFVRRMDASSGFVEAANLPEWTWDEAQRWYATSDIDALWAERHQGHPTQQEQRRQELADRIATLIGTTDPAAIAAVVAGLRNGESTIVAVHNAGQRMHDAMYSAAIHEYMGQSGLTFAEAEVRALEMQEQVIELVQAGFTANEAQMVVRSADLAGFDIDEIVDTATVQELSLTEAFNLHVHADHFAMTADQFIAFQGLQTHFEVLANPMSRLAGDEREIDNVYRVGNYPTGSSHRAADHLVTVEDLRLIVGSPAHFTDAEVATARQLLNNLDLLRRLDSARDNTSVVSDVDAFGSTDFDDGRISLDDIHSFMAKQSINSIIGERYDEIDNVHGGERDGFLSREDFETYLANNRASMTPAEVQAFEDVVTAELYDETWLEENKQSIAIAGAVVVGAGITVLTAGTGVGLFATMLMAGAGGATAAGATTLGINALTGEELLDEVGTNSALGGLGGVAGMGLATALPAWSAATTNLGRFAVASGTVSDAAGIVGMGGADWALDAIPGVDHEDLDGMHETAEAISIATGVLGVSAAAADFLARRIDASLAAELAADMTDVQIADSFVPLGLDQAEALEILRARSLDGQPATLGESLLEALAQADRDLTDFGAEAIALRMLTAGTESPGALIVTNQPIVRLVPVGQEFTHEFSGWMFLDDYVELAESGRDVFDALSMPYLQHAPDYQPWIMLPGVDCATVFASEVAPAMQLDGIVQTSGGTQQVVVPDPSMFTEALPYSAPIPRAAPTEFPVREVANIVHSGMGAPITEAASRVDDAELFLEGVELVYDDSGSSEFAG